MVSLPKHLTEERFRIVRTERDVTDCRLAKTPYGRLIDFLIFVCYSEGKSRRFGFVGFRSDTDALAAKKFFDNTFVDTSRICRLALAVLCVLADLDHA